MTPQKLRAAHKLLDDESQDVKAVAATIGVSPVTLYRHLAKHRERTDC